MGVFFKRVIAILKYYIPLQAMGLIFSILLAISEIASPMVSKYCIDEVIPGNSMEKLYLGIGVFVIVCTMQPILGYLCGMIFLRLKEKISLNLKNQVFSKIVHAPINFYDKTYEGHIISRILNDGNAAASFLSSFMTGFLQNLILLIMIIAAMLYLSVKITVIVLTFFIIYYIIYYLVSRRFRNLSMILQKNYDMECTAITQTINSIDTLKSYMLEEEKISHYNELLKKCYKDNIKIGTLSMLVNNLTSIVRIISLSLIYGIGSISVMKGESSVGDIIAIGLYFQMFTGPFMGLLQNATNIQKNIPIFDRLYEYLNMKTEKLDQEEGGRLEGDIILDNISFSYEKDSYALKNINMKIKSRTITAITGTSGSGKSSLIKIIAGFYNNFTGQIIFSGRNMKEMCLKDIRRNIGYVSQNVELFNISLKDNIRCGDKKVSDKDIINICRRLQIHDKIISLPKGYESIVNERINLSGGEIQRIGIARALIKKPSILILDEPTASLDTDNEAAVAEILQEIKKECTVIVVSHRHSTIEMADKVITLHKGEVYEEKPFYENLSKDHVEAII
ncbi:peptidase domain-containing ABC transporter [Herbinix luporum]|jgi:ATP-binding cassette subfamily B protein|uniref:ABC transporter ATP-binding protein n=1 Tax=Herbinix luporum TaxID=1679721 RepID=A0A0K8J639_9FIRM|nr:ABC transporter ATP-binding protein [Herbinix luporum]CUH92829.1 hypothetical protein SD1D_1283 [Herbinix luporum]HHT57331.1 ABC transporter ATP-binding protein [Herbinix luporum]